MKTIQSILLGSTAVLASAIPAFAHSGNHTELGFAAIGHWLSSPSHALLTLITGIVAIAILVKLSKNRT